MNASINSPSRNRLYLLIRIFIVIGLGLASRKFPLLFPAVLGKYPGDVLWGLMLYFIVAFILKGASPVRIAILTALIAVADELSQLIQLPWLNTIRHTFIGHLILGSVFSWHDIMAYLVGIGIGFILDKIFLQSNSKVNNLPD